MSLVGPRPERPEFFGVLASQLPDYSLRVSVRAGITGLAQVRGWRGNTSLRHRLDSDLEYLRMWSPWQDCRILLRTCHTLLLEAVGRRASSSARRKTSS